MRLCYSKYSQNSESIFWAQPVRNKRKCTKIDTRWSSSMASAYFAIGWLIFSCGLTGRTYFGLQHTKRNLAPPSSGLPEAGVGSIILVDRGAILQRSHGRPTYSRPIRISVLPAGGLPASFHRATRPCLRVPRPKSAEVVRHLATLLPAFAGRTPPLPLSRRRFSEYSKYSEFDQKTKLAVFFESSVDD